MQSVRSYRSVLCGPMRSVRSVRSVGGAGIGGPMRLSVNRYRSVVVAGGGFCS